jgi:hypothetical protein
MPLPDDKTISFDLWPHLLMIEGATSKIGALIAAIYDDPSIPNDAWSVSTKEKSRKTFAETLRQAGDVKLRLGMGVRTDALIETIQARAMAMGLNSFPFSGKSQAAI